MKNLLVHINNSKQCPKRLDVAAALAARHSALVTGLYVVPRPYVSPFMDAGKLDLLIMKAGAAEERGERAANRFSQVMQAAGVGFESAPVDGYPAAALSANAHFVDLVIMGQHDPEDEQDHDPRDLPVEVAMLSGRPVLMVPYGSAPKEPGKKMLVAWDGSRAAVRAVYDAMPLLAQAEEALLLSVNPDSPVAGRGDTPGADMESALRRHGVKVKGVTINDSKATVSEVIRRSAEDMQADTIVMGAYGHSRVRELLLGGATSSLLANTKVNLFLAH